MENQIISWSRDLFTIIVSISFLEILIPETSMKKYIKFIFSMIVLTVLLEPAAKLILMLKH